METATVNPMDKLTARQKQFVNQYLDCMNATEAARRCGYSERSAYNQGHRMMKNDEVRAAISSEGERLAMTSGEAVKHFTDIARTRLNDYFTVVKVLHTPTVRKPLQQLIDELDAEIAFEDAYAKAAKLGAREMKKHKYEQKERELLGIRYSLELEMNPKAYRDVAGEQEWVDREKLDLVALVRDRRLGRIKSYQITEFGPKVEMYSAENAIDKILQLHGRYKQLPGDLGNKEAKIIYRLPDGTELEL